MKPNDEQAFAIAAMLTHLRTKDNKPFFKFEGPAGTGKTFSMAFVLQEYKRRAIMTAPTNKAVRVLRDSLEAQALKVECRTIYSLLGLQLQANGEVKELAKPEDPVDLGDVSAIGIDEDSMVNKNLWSHITEASERFPHIRWILMGDPYQLPPVGEVNSPINELKTDARLNKIMRQDNQILAFATHLRWMVENPFGKLQIVANNDGDEGIWTCPIGGLETAIMANSEGFAKGENKAMAWRNATVDKLNALIRAELFDNVIEYPWQKGDRITLLEPAKDFDNEIIGITDEEGAVETAELAPHPLHGDFMCWRIVMRSDSNRAMTLWTLADTPSNKIRFEQRKARLSAAARVDRSQWKEFWGFVESFHKVRHAYAITVHRAQGSTYQRAFVSWRDILANQNRVEAMRCLYVAATRPKKELYLG